MYLMCILLHVMVSMVLTRADNYCIDNYMKTIQNINLKLIIYGYTLNPHTTNCVSGFLAI